jgi:PAS domain S-box-containing protein
MNPVGLRIARLCHFAAVVQCPSNAGSAMRNPSDTRMSRYLPFVIGLVAGLATLALWRALDVQEARSRYEILVARAAAARGGIEARMQMTMQALLRMANRWQLRGELASPDWLADAELYVRHDPAYRALLWLDGQWVPRLWVQRAATGRIVRGSGPAVDVSIARALAGCQSPPPAQTLCWPIAAGKGEALLVVDPIVAGARTIGFIVGVFDPTTMLARLLEIDATLGHTAGITDQKGTVVLRNGSESGDPDAAGDMAGAPLALPGLEWRVLVWSAPPPGAFHVFSSLPATTLISGLLISGLLAVLTRLTQTARWRAMGLDHLNHKLGEQMRMCAVAQVGLQQRETILAVVSLAAEELLRAVRLDESIPRMMHHLGEAIAVSRVRVFENHRGAGAGDEALATLRYEWCRPGIPSCLDDPAAPCFRPHVGGVKRWRENLSRGEAVTVHVSDLAPEEQALLVPEGIVSLLAIPIFVEECFWGFISFQDCTVRRDWTGAEIHALKTAAAVVGAAIGHTRAVMQLRDSEERFSQLAENVQEVFWIVDSQARRVLYVSPAYEEMWGQPRERLCADLMSFLDSVHPEDYDRVCTTVESALNDPRPIDMEFRMIRPDGTVRWIRSRGSPARSECTPTQRIVGITEDVTDRRLAEEERVARAELQRDILVREVHHRINNNLQGVMSLLRQRIRVHPELRAALEEAMIQINAVAVIHGLQGRGREREVRLGILVTAIAEGVVGTRASTLPVTADPAGAGDIVIMEAETVPVALMINELVLNAIKHADRARPGAKIVIDFERFGQGVKVHVRNPAGGLPAGFDFEAGRGLGTGLGLVKSLMPPRGISLALRFTGGGVEASLILTAPVIGAAADHQNARTGT